MADLATLGIEIRSDGVLTASRNLDRFSKSGQQAERQTSQLERGMRKTGQAVSRFGRDLVSLRGALAGLGIGLAVRQLDQMAQRALATAESISDVAQQAGVSAEKLQVLRRAFDQSGGSAQQMDEALIKFNRRIGLADDGAGAAQNAVERLGLSLRDASGRMRDTDDILDAVVDQLAAMEDQSIRASTASEFFGDRVGPRLAPLLAQGTEGIAKFRGELERANVLMEDDLVAAGAKASAALRGVRDDLSSAFQIGILEGFGDKLGTLEERFESEGLRTGINLLGQTLAGAASSALDVVEALGLIADRIDRRFNPDSLGQLAGLADQITDTSDRLEGINTQLRQHAEGSVPLTNQAYQTLSQRAEELMRDLFALRNEYREVVGATDDTTEATKGAKDGMDEMGGGAEDAAKALEAMTAANKSALESVTEGREALADMSEEYDNLLNTLDPTRAAISEFAERQEFLSQALRDGVIDAEQYQRALALLNQEFVEAGNATQEAQDGLRDLSGQVRRGAREFETAGGVITGAIEGAGRSIQETLAG